MVKYGDCSQREGAQLIYQQLFGGEIDFLHLFSKTVQASLKELPNLMKPTFLSLSKASDT
jgi:hypothetical protein